MKLHLSVYYLFRHAMSARKFTSIEVQVLLTFAVLDVLDLKVNCRNQRSYKVKFIEHTRTFTVN